MLRFSAIVSAALLSSPAAILAGGLAGQDIRIGVAGPLTTPSATFGVEMRQAVDLAIDERNAAGGLLGAKVVAEVIDDQADAEK
jgi:branched-chain amino acid transport system substrate-binding protein